MCGAAHARGFERQRGRSRMRSDAARRRWLDVAAMLAVEVRDRPDAAAVVCARRLQCRTAAGGPSRACLGMSKGQGLVCALH